MGRSFSALAMTLVFLCGMGAQWALLQSVAWASMYARDGRLDVQRPCGMCRVVERGSRSQPQGKTHAPTLPDFGAHAPPRAVRPETTELPIFSPPMTAVQIDRSIETPPPKAAA